MSLIFRGWRSEPLAFDNRSMNRQQQIDRFLSDAHRLIVERLRADPARISEASDQLNRWRAQAGDTRSDVYWNEWEQLLAQGADAIEQRVCGADDHAAVLRSVSPLSVLISQHERFAMLRQARQAE